MQKISQRLVMHAKDIMQITGKCERTSRRMIARIRKNNSQEKRTWVSIEEFSRHSGISQENIRSIIN